MTRTLAAELLALTLLAGACTDQDDEASAESTGPPARPVIGAWHELVAEVDGDMVLVNGYPEDGTDPVRSSCGHGTARGGPRSSQPAIAPLLVTSPASPGTAPEARSCSTAG